MSDVQKGRMAQVMAACALLAAAACVVAVLALNKKPPRLDPGAADAGHAGRVAPANGSGWG